MRRRWARWLVGALGVGFGFLAYVYLTLPDVRGLASENPATTAFIELRREEAHDRGRNFNLRRRWVPYNRIANSLKRAVIVAEDSAFFEHEGLDYEQIRESIEDSFEDGGAIRGASTITQQLAKNLYLSESRNPVRKLRELIITRRLEAALSKRRILEIYLNSIEWGDGIFGCEAAARAYFGKGAAELGAANRRCSPAPSSTPGSTARRGRRAGSCAASRSSCGAWGRPSRRRTCRRPPPIRRRRAPARSTATAAALSGVSGRDGRRRSACASTRW